MNIVAFLFVGLIAGWIASTLVEGHGLGLFRDMAVGIIGAFVGGFIFNIFGITTYGFWSSMITSIVGAMVFLYVLALFTRSSRPSKPLDKMK